jgi:hypothetical protein
MLTCWHCIAACRDFPNTYTMGKHFTEQLVADFHRQSLPVAIVRPTLVCGLAGAPYPGFCGNLAGKLGAPQRKPCADHNADVDITTLMLVSCGRLTNSFSQGAAAQHNIMATSELQ